MKKKICLVASLKLHFLRNILILVWYAWYNPVNNTLEPEKRDLKNIV